MSSPGPTVLASNEDFQFAPFNSVPAYTPSIWQGMRLGHWLQLLAEHRFRISPSRIPKLLYSLTTTYLAPGAIAAQHLVYGRKAQRTPLVDDPIFVIGHWRSGTTLLHELFTLDDRLRSPNTYHAFNPFASLLTESWFKPLTHCLLPRQRPMDNMDFGWDTPQEDEFAIVAMGLPTPYRRMAFPNEGPRHLNYLNMTDVPADDMQLWKKRFHRYVDYLNLHYSKRLVLKSPPHTGRIRVLLEMFPNAKFVHITRDPQRFIPSTMHLWGALDEHNAMQEPRHDDLRSYVFSCFEHLYDGFFRDEPLLGRHNFLSVRFNDLVADPIGEMKQIYRQLDLGSPETTIPRIQERMTRTRDYQPNRHAAPSDLQDEIRERCAIYSDRFGYTSESVAA